MYQNKTPTLPMSYHVERAPYPFQTFGMAGQMENSSNSSISCNWLIPVSSEPIGYWKRRKTGDLVTLQHGKKVTKYAVDVSGPSNAMGENVICCWNREVGSGSPNPHQKGRAAALETRKYSSVITSY
ncbi:hypothetical protein B0H14DRAFT_2559525 [Mycena olivaceomarginata]|nr:hypothetical protein B0H14DRAFT_2559525 [Mycena olivaceomarginata]